MSSCHRLSGGWWLGQPRLAGNANVEEVFHRCGFGGLSCRMMETSFFMSHESLIIGKRPWYLRLRGKLSAAAA
ncbi:hypothetical protein MJ579_00725 [Klebsiella pneumoniae]|nr:hypothetical protein MJ579_00725 [Klebsiella pneumoniae]